MENQAVTNKKFKNLKDAFASLPEKTKQHSIRVAEYTKAMFVQAVAVEMRLGDPKAEAQLDPSYERAAYLCGLYHDIGKALVPEAYHVESESFVAEEKALYRKHTTDGVALARELDFGEELSKVEQEMVYQAIEFHHQRPDGLGYPDVSGEDKIPTMALLTGFSNALDHRVSVKVSETPFDDVMKEIQGKFQEESELQLVVTEGQSKLSRVFQKYQAQSLKIPTPTPFVKRKNARPFELKYRPIVDRRQRTTVGLLAKMYFKDNKDTYVEYEEVKTILNKNKIIADVGRYFLYEAGDTIKRIEACELPITYVALSLMPTYYTQTKIVAAIQQQLEDARMEKGKLLLSMEETMFEAPSKALLTNLERLSAAGIPLMITGWKGEHLKIEELLKYSVAKVILHPDFYPKLEEDEMDRIMNQLTEAGIEAIAGELDKTKYNGQLNSLGIYSMTGPLAGDYVTEDEIILEELKVKLSK